MKLETKIEIIVRLLIILILLIDLGLFLFKYFYNDNKLIIKTWLKKKREKNAMACNRGNFCFKKLKKYAVNYLTIRLKEWTSFFFVSLFVCFFFGRIEIPTLTPHPTPPPPHWNSIKIKTKSKTPIILFIFLILTFKFMYYKIQNQL